MGKDGNGGSDATAGLEEDEDEAADDEGGAGYLKRESLPASGFGLRGLKILRGSTVGLSHSSAEGPGLLIKSSSSGTSRDRWFAILRCFAKPANMAAIQGRAAGLHAE